MPDLVLEYDDLNAGHGPLAQASGRVNGRGFSFRARHPTWEFEMANDAGDLPSDVGGNPILHVEGWYPDTPGDMTEAQARRIIDRCAAMYAELISF